MNYGIFNAFWDGSPNHLPFLSFSDNNINSEGWGLPKSIGLIRDILSKNIEDDIVRGIKLLLKDCNWRMNLVACVAIILSSEEVKVKIIESLWERLLLGSWVSPQIACTISIVDKNFKIKALALLSGDLYIDKKLKLALEYIINNKISEILIDDDGGRMAENWIRNIKRVI